MKPNRVRDFVEDFKANGPFELNEEHVKLLQMFVEWQDGHYMVTSISLGSAPGSFTWTPPDGAARRTLTSHGSS